MAAHDDELQQLRKRAYGRAPDIHLDPAALQRLRELEEPVVAPVRDEAEEPEPAVGDAGTTGDPATDRAYDGRDAYIADGDADEPAPRTPLIERLRPLVNARRSTKLILLGVALFAITVATVLTVVQRVQTDPLQVGAEQVARLSPDAGYDLPAIFTVGAEASTDIQAYDGFYGLRAIIGSASLYGQGDPDSTCLSIFWDANGSDSDSFSGPIFGGCSAGDFPAMAQFTIDADNLPSNVEDPSGDLRAAFPEARAFQFVYDPASEEVVVFADNGP